MRSFMPLCAAAASVLIAATANAGPIDGRFNYQGRLTSAGLPVNGLVDVRFSLWDTDVAGVQKGPTIDVLGESITDGLFNVDLDFGVAALSGEQRWLQIEVRSPAGVGGYSTLGRQEILGAPYAIQTRGLFVDDALNVGIGTLAPAGLLHVKDPADGRSLLYSPNAFFDFSLTSPTGAVVLGNAPFNAGEHSQLFFRDGVGGTLNAVIGAASPDGNGFLNIYGEGGAFNFQVHGNPDGTADGVSNTRLFIRSSGPGGVGGEVSVLNNDGDETIELLGGGSADGGTLSMFEPAAGFTTIFMKSNDSLGGALIRTYSEDGFQQFNVEPDSSGSGTFFSLTRNDSSNGLVFDGNDSGTGDAQLTISGAFRSVNIQTRLTGSASVELPTDAIQATEILDEPGVASVLNNTNVVLTGAVDTILSRTITVPASGFCVVIGTCEASAFHTTGTRSNANFGVSDNVSSFPVHQRLQVRLDEALPTGGYDQPVTVHGTFSVSAGANTFYLLGHELGGAFTVHDRQLTVMYFPTAYGTVTPTVLARGGARDDGSSPPMPAMTPDDIYAEQVQAAAFDQNRRAAEAADYAQKFAELEARLRAVEAQQGMDGRAPRRASPPIDESRSGVVLGHNATNSR